MITLPILAPFRYFVLRKHRRYTQTAIIPFSCIKKAVVLVDRREEGWEQAASEAEAFFKEKKIKALILSPGPRDKDVFGRIKRSIRYPDPSDTAEDLLISLYSVPAFEMKYEVLCSDFRMGMGRLGTGLQFDTVIKNPEGLAPSQAEVFRIIADLIAKCV